MLKPPLSLLANPPIHFTSHFSPNICAMQMLAAPRSIISAAQHFSSHTPVHHLSSQKPFFSYKPTLLNFQSLQNLPSSLSNPTLSTPQRLLCKPPFGKHVRRDYLVDKLSAKEIQDLVRGDRNVPLIIDFYATWCGPCILMAQELEMLAVEYENKAMIVKVDTDDEYEFARDMQVRGLPTLYFISPDPNKDAIRTEGLIPIQMMRDILDNQM